MLTTLAPSSGEKHNQTCPYTCLRALLLRRLRRIGSNRLPLILAHLLFRLLVFCLALPQG